MGGHRLRIKTKWITGVIAIALFSALAASLLTTALLVRGLLSNKGSRWVSLLAGQAAETLLPDNTTVATESTTKTGGITITPAAPTSRPYTPSPRPTLTAKPTPEPQPTTTAAPSASVTPTQAAPLSPQVSPGETPSLSPTPSAEPSQSAGEPLPNPHLWELYQLVQEAYAEIAPAVVRIQVVVPSKYTKTVQTDEASGLIVDEKGLIVTDASVMDIALDKNGGLLAEARIEIMVHQADRILQATYLGRDQVTGVAAFSIKNGEKKLTVPRFALTPELHVGQTVLAVGYPEMLMAEGGLTSGFISALNRTVILEDGLSIQMIQTDLKISSRDAGGPLLNLQGEVIGLTNCGLITDPLDTRLRALPVDALLYVARALESADKPGERAWLGITVLHESSFLELQRLYRFPDGLYISSVIQDSPAYVADLRRNDVIVSINDEAVSPTMDLSTFLQAQPVGTELQLRVFRRSESRVIDLVVYLQELQS